jgi:hypothetical protein
LPPAIGCGGIKKWRRMRAVCPKGIN